MDFRITNVIEYRINKLGEKFDYNWDKLSKPSIFKFDGSDSTSPLITVIGGQVHVFHSDSNANSISFKISTEHIAVEDMEEFEINIC